MAHNVLYVNLNSRTQCVCELFVRIHAQNGAVCEPASLQE